MPVFNIKQQLIIGYELLLMGLASLFLLPALTLTSPLCLCLLSNLLFLSQLFRLFKPQASDARNYLLPALVAFNLLIVLICSVLQIPTYLPELGRIWRYPAVYFWLIGLVLLASQHLAADFLTSQFVTGLMLRLVWLAVLISFVVLCGIVGIYLSA